MRLAVFFRLRLRLSLQNTAALPTPILSLNLVQRPGGSQPEMAKQLKALEKENSRLKKMVAEQALDMEILKEAAKGNW
jgi:hypothetical protein